MQVKKIYIKPEAEIAGTVIDNIMLELSVFDKVVDDEAANKGYFDEEGDEYDSFFEE